LGAIEPFGSRFFGPGCEMIRARYIVVRARLLPFIEPCRPKLAKRLPTGEKWSHQRPGYGEAHWSRNATGLDDGVVGTMWCTIARYWKGARSRRIGTSIQRTIQTSRHMIRR
jgi:hypothetical protein